jgi:hypothetical protein
LADFDAYDPHFLGGVRVAVGDVNGDGIPDIITAPGPGGGPHVKVIDGTKLGMVDANNEIGPGALIGQFYAYDPTFAGGVFVAFGEGTNAVPEIVTGAGAGGGPHVKVIDGTKLNQLQPNAEIAASALLGSFFAYSPFFGGGVRVAAADINGDGVIDIITGAGPGGGPHVKVIDGTKLSELQSDVEIANSALLGQFFAYAPNFNGGVYVAANTIGGHAYIITGAGAGNIGPRVRVIDATQLNLLDSNSEPTGAALLGDFFAYSPMFSGGVEVAATINPDGTVDIITGAGPGGGPHVRIFSGATGQQLQQNAVDSFFAFDAAFAGGVFVGGGS